MEIAPGLEADIPEGWEAVAVTFPEYDADDAARFLDLCARDECGCYGTCWSCPPGWTERLDSLGERFGSALLIERTFPFGPGDADALAAASEGLHLALRLVVADLRARGVPAMGFADGRCGYCGVCSYPEPCRFPEQLVPSISATGTDLAKVLAGAGREFRFRGDSVTLYGMVLYGSPARARKD